MRAPEQKEVHSAGNIFPVRGILKWEHKHLWKRSPGVTARFDHNNIPIVAIYLPLLRRGQIYLPSLFTEAFRSADKLKKLEERCDVEKTGRCKTKLECKSSPPVSRLPDSQYTWLLKRTRCKQCEINTSVGVNWATGVEGELFIVRLVVCQCRYVLLRAVGWMYKAQYKAILDVIFLWFLARKCHWLD